MAERFRSYFIFKAELNSIQTRLLQGLRGKEKSQVLPQREDRVGPSQVGTFLPLGAHPGPLQLHGFMGWVVLLKCTHGGCCSPSP